MDKHSLFEFFQQTLPHIREAKCGVGGHASIASPLPWMIAGMPTAANLLRGRSAHSSAVKFLIPTPLFKFPGLRRLSGLFALVSCLVAPLHAADLEYRFSAWWKPELKAIDRRLASIDRAMLELPQMPDIDARGTHGFHSDFTLDSESNWFRIDWAKPREIDAISLIPTRLTTQSGVMSNYGLPNRLRIEAGLPGQDEPVVLTEVADTRLATRRGEPLFIELPPTRVLWLRFIPIKLPTLPGKSVRFFSASSSASNTNPTSSPPRASCSRNSRCSKEKPITPSAGRCGHRMRWRPAPTTQRVSGAPPA